MVVILKLMMRLKVGNSFTFLFWVELFHYSRILFD
jgi:hypothetical protein